MRICEAGSKCGWLHPELTARRLCELDVGQKGALLERLRLVPARGVLEELLVRGAHVSLRTWGWGVG